MLGHRALQMEDYFEMLKRRWLLIAACVIAVFPAAVWVSYLVPPVYESQTLVLVQHQVVPQDYVKPVVNEDLDAQLASMKEQIESRSRLEPIITRYGLFAGKGITMDDRVAQTRKAIKVSQIQSDTGHGGTPGFTVAFDARDPHTAQLVCGEITSLFLTENLNSMQQAAVGTTNFLKQQLDDAKRTLDEQDARLAAFQQKYLGRLPDEENQNTNTLQALTTQLDSVTQSISQMQQNETFLQTMIAQQKNNLANGTSQVQEAQDQRESELKSLLQQKTQLDAQYTSDYPDVVAVTRRIAKLEAEIKNHPFQPSMNPPAPGAQADAPQLRNLQAQLHAVQLALVPARQEQSRIQNSIRVYEARIEQSPQVEAEYKQITRDHATAVQFYDSLLTKMNESSMATALQQRQQGEQFSMMDPPNLPESPKFPNHAVFAVGGFFGGLGLGLLIAALLEFGDTSLRSEADIWAFTNLPTLAVISYTGKLRRMRKRPPRPGITPGHETVESASS
jgi:protein tyrosine kinase modulator